MLLHPCLERQPAATHSHSPSAMQPHSVAVSAAAAEAAVVVSFWFGHCTPSVPVPPVEMHQPQRLVRAD